MTVPDDMNDPAWQFKRLSGSGGRRIDSVYIHYTESGDLGNARQTYETIDRWHRNRGFIMIGYHGVFTPRGKFAEGRPEYMVGAHVSGHNWTSLGLCNVGSDKYDWYPTNIQYQKTAEKCREWMSRYPLITLDRIWPHKAHQSTSCPGRFDMNRLKDLIKQEVPKEPMSRFSTRETAGSHRVKLFEGHAYIGPNLGQQTQEDCWIAMTPFDGETHIKLQVITDDAIKTAEYDVKANKLKEVALSGFGLRGPVTFRVSADKEIALTVDWRGWT